EATSTPSQTSPSLVRTAWGTKFRRRAPSRSTFRTLRIGNMTKPRRFLRAVLAVASLVGAQSGTGKQQSGVTQLGRPSGVPNPAGAAAPTARFSFTPDRPTAFVPVAFDGKSSCPEGGFPGGCIPSDRSIVGFSWDFGDGGTDSGPTVSHTFKTSGPFS